MQAVDLAIQNGVDLDGTPIPQKMLDLYNRIMDEENKRQRSGVKKSMINKYNLKNSRSLFFVLIWF